MEKLKTLAAGEKPFLLAVGFMPPLPFVAPGVYFDKFPVDTSSWELQPHRDGASSHS